MTRAKSDPATLVVLDRAGSTVLNVLVVDALAIALSGWALSRRALGLAPFMPWIAQRAAYLMLCVLMAASLATRWLLASPRALRDPARRASRLFRAHVLSAAVGALAVPLGFGYAWEFQPTLEGVGPFWATALAMGLLALPRPSDYRMVLRPTRPPAEPER